MEIGIVQNKINDHCVEFWFYRKSLKDNVWKRIGVERVANKYIRYTLSKMGKEAKLVALGKGT